MKEKVGKVTLNYEFYQGSDAYSDGAIEDELLHMVEQESDVRKILKSDNRWPILYHLSPVRQSIVDWYPVEEGASVLEVGSGCGAVTGALCRKAEKVTAVDLSKRRSLVNANRNRECENLEIVVGNFNDIRLEEKFDYITLIGVLEYAAYYTQAQEPFGAFLENIGRMLKPEGRVLIAIENKFGLKYWAGAREDHTGLFFDGLEGYHGSKSQAETFSREELDALLEGAGYCRRKFYYPFPDYKFPRQIFSDDYLPKAEDLACSLQSYDNSRMFLFNETAVFGELLKAGKFPFFSNSFFIVAGMNRER